jgi:hypothetical protein
MSKILNPRPWITAAALVLILLPLSHPSFAMASTGSMYSKSSLPTNFNQLDMIGSSLSTFQDEANPLSDRGFDAVKEEFNALNKFQEQSNHIMESLESICSENGRICENMMAALDAPSVRDEQHLERIRQMEATVMNEDVCSIEVFFLVASFVLLSKWDQQPKKTTQRD